MHVLCRRLGRKKDDAKLYKDEPLKRESFPIDGLQRRLSVKAAVANGSVPNIPKIPRYMYLTAHRLCRCRLYLHENGGFIVISTARSFLSCDPSLAVYPSWLA